MLKTISSKVEDAYARIHPYIHKTALEYSPEFSAITCSKVFLKLEFQQISGSFKYRGAMNKLLTIKNDKTVIAASTGNHAAAMAHACQKLNKKGKVFMPTTVNPAKLKSLSKFNLDIELMGEEAGATEAYGEAFAKKNELPFAHPYNDEEIIAGQGTIAIELLKDLPDIDAIFVPIGGGGIISGIAAFIKEHSPTTKIIGCQPTHSKIMHASIAAGHIVEGESLPTISDATAGGISKNSITFNLVQQTVDEIILLSEQEIESAMQLMLIHHFTLIEGGSAMTIAALIKTAKLWRDKNVVCVLTGKKVDFEVLKKIVANYE